MNETANSGPDDATAIAPETLYDKRQSAILWDEYRRFHETAPIGYFTLDVEGTILNVNLSGARFLSSTPQKLTGSKLSDFVADQAGFYRSLMAGVLGGDQWQQSETELERTDGSRICVLVQARQIVNAGEVVVFVTDITERILAERALKENEQKYREVADRLAEGVFEADANGKVTYANARVLESTGLNESDLVGGLSVFDVIAPESLPSARERMARVLRGEDVGAGEYSLLRKDGSIFPALVHSLAVVREGKVIGVRGILIDISERKRDETAVQDSERKYRELADLLGAGIFEADTRGQLTYANLKGLASFGLDENDVRNGLRVFDVIASAELETARDNFSKVLRQEDLGPVEYTMARKDGSTFQGLTYASPIVRDEEVVGVRGVVVDISDRKNVENALRESERKYRELTDQLDEGVYELDLDGMITYANRKGLAYLGLCQEDIEKGVNGFDLVVHEDPDLVKSRFARLLNGEDIGAIEYVYRRKDGTTFPALTHSSAVVRDGIAQGMRGVIIDISELKRAENALKDSEQKYREMTDLLDEGVYEMDLNGRFTYANRKGLVYLGVEENDLANGLSAFDIVLPKDVERAKEVLEAAIAARDTGAVEFDIRKKDGTTFPALTHASAIIRGGKVVGIRGVVFDISDIKETERALRESEERFRTFVKSLHEGIWVLDKDDITTYVNPRMAEMLGYSEEEMIGKPVYSFNDEEWKKFTLDSLERRKEGVSEQLEGEMVRKDGGRVHALLEASPILDQDGRYVGSIAGVQDITDRKMAEENLRQTLSELDRSNKELEQFAYVTSHDLREPLRMMTSFSQSLEKRYKDKLDSTANEYIHFIVDGAARMQRLIDDILIYSRVTTRAMPFVPVNMEDVLQDVLSNLKVAAEDAKAQIVHEPLPVIQADPSQMSQVLQNLIGNALKFSRDGVSPVVRITARQEQDEWVFSVSDNGIGIDPELFGKLFNLFQRLHPPDKYPGTGVGLAVTKKIVERHGGRIWIESEPGRGSSFLFSLPLKD